MVIRWIHVATLVVVTLTSSHCKKNETQPNGKQGDLCPCLPRHICPRAFGTKPEDRKYLGEIVKCENDFEVRCCGASSSYIVGMRNSKESKDEMILNATQQSQPHLLSRLNSNDENGNEISITENSDFTTTLSIDGEFNELPVLEEVDNHGSIQQKQIMDEVPAESKSITTDALQEREFKSLNEIEVTETDDSTPKIPEETQNTEATTEVRIISHRRPKMLNNVMMVYPNLMSGIPKTTPKNLPESNEMKIFDDDLGTDLHLVFSKTTLEPIPILRTSTYDDESDVDSTTEFPHNRFAKRRRKYRPMQRKTIKSSENDVELKPTNPPTVTKRPINRQTSLYKRRPSPQETRNATTKILRTRPTTKLSTGQDEEMLQTSEDDNSPQNRSRLYNSRHRLNYLRRSTSTTTESPVESSIRQTFRSKDIESKTPSKMYESLKREMDTNHENVMKRVRTAIETALPEIRVIPRSYASVDMDRRVKKVEKMFVREMTNAYTEINSTLRDHLLRPLEHSDIVPVNPQSRNSEISTKKLTSNSTRPYRGKQKFQFSDLHTPMLIKNPNEVGITRTPNEVRRTRIRSTTLKPTEISATEDVVTKPKSRRRNLRPSTTTIQPILSEQYRKSSESSKQRRISTPTRATIDIIPTEGSTVQTTGTPLTTIPTTTLQTITPTPTIPITTTGETPTSIQYTTTPSSDITDQTEVLPQLDQKNIQTEDETTMPSDSGNVLNEFRPSPLWSIKSDEPDELVNRTSNHRRSRTIFVAPDIYFDGFIPAVSANNREFTIEPINENSLEEMEISKFN